MWTLLLDGSVDFETIVEVPWLSFRQFVSLAGKNAKCQKYKGVKCKGPFLGINIEISTSFGPQYNYLCALRYS